MSGNIYWTPRGFERGWGKRFGSLVKRQENVHENLFTQNCRKASRMRIKVQVPSVWRADVCLADNYNPFKANKSAIMLFQHEGSKAGADTGSRFLIGCQLMRGKERNFGACNSIRLSWSQVSPGITSITHPLWTLYGLIWGLISMRWAGVCITGDTTLVYKHQVWTQPPSTCSKWSSKTLPV